MTLADQLSEASEAAPLTNEQIVAELRSIVENLTESLERAKRNVAEWEKAARKRSAIQGERDLVMKNLGGAHAERAAYVDARSEVLRLLNKMSRSS